MEGREFIGSGHNKKQAKSAASEVALKALNWVSLPARKYSIVFYRSQYQAGMNENSMKRKRQW